MATCAASLSLSPLNPKALSLSNKTTGGLPLRFLSSLQPTTLSVSVAQSQRVISSSSHRFVRKVSLSSDFDQEEDLLSDGEERGFTSPDLKLFVGNLPFSADSAQLADLFGSAGQVETAEVIYDKMTGRSRGFGFVTMSTSDEVEAAAQQFNGYELDGRSLKVNYGPPPPRREFRDDFSSSRGGREFRNDFSSSRGGREFRNDFSSSRGRREFRNDFSSSRGGGGGGGGRSNFDNPNRIHVGNLAWGVDDFALKKLFGEQGNVVEAKVVFDRESGRSRGFGFVTYNTAEEVRSAVESLDGADLNGRSIRVTQAEPRQRRQF